MSGAADRVYAIPSPLEQPSTPIPVGLVGTADQTSFELTGTLIFDRLYADRSAVEAAAKARLAGEPSALPNGTQVLADSITITVGAASTAGGQFAVTVSVRALAAAAIDEGVLRDRVAGLSVPEAQAALANLGKVEVDLWPGWVDHIPRLGFRIAVLTVAPAASGS
jgi:hypothetical protein